MTVFFDREFLSAKVEKHFTNLSPSHYINML